MVRCSRLILLLGLLAAAAVRADEVPEALSAWRDWVLHGYEQNQCPILLGYGHDDISAHLCAWPGTLRIEVEGDSARFTQSWQVLAESLVPLPGDERLRPQSVTQDGTAAPVLFRNGRAELRLDAGNYRIEGVLRWSRRPETLPVPIEVGLVDLVLDGKPLPLAERNGDRLWLGRTQTDVGVDALGLRVYRRLSDGIPLRLETELALEVSGRARDVQLGPVLPAGFVPVAVRSPIPAELKADGRVAVQLRPGSWRLRIEARAAAPQAKFKISGAAAPWPAEEIWSWQAAPELRVTQPLADLPVDPAQVGVPWEGLPSFVLSGETELSIEERSRGLPEDRAHRLSLRRVSWLDFDGGGFTVRDVISGELARPGRLDMRAPWQLQRAASHGDDLLVTAGLTTGQQGVELRDPQVDLQTTSRLPARGPGSASGWAQDFESMQLSLHLPPGWRLWHAAGADAAPGAWWAQWSLLDLFLLALSALLAQRLYGYGFAALITGYLLLGYQESDSPLWSLLGVLLLTLLLGMLPAGRFASAVRMGRRGLFAIAVLLSLPFALQQLRLAHFPQLELDQVGRGGGAYSGYARNVASSMPMEEAPMPAAPPPQQESPAPARKAMPQEMLAQTMDQVAVGGSRISGLELKQKLNAYPSDAIVQAGPGTPDWSWRSESIVWNGPLLATQELNLWLSAPWLTRLLRIAVVVLLALVLLRLARVEWPGRLRALAAAGLLAVAPVQAADFPAPELLNDYRTRLLEAPRCSPQCGALATAELDLAGDQISLRLEFHADAEVALPLPQPGPGVALVALRLDGSGAFVRAQLGARWVRIPRGVHRADLDWRIGSIEALDLRFPLPPARIVVRTPGWEVAGLDGERLSGDTLQLVRRREVERSTADAATATQDVPPFVRVTRRLALDLDWSLVTSVERVAPQAGGFTLSLPLLADERVQGEALEVKEGRITLSFGAGQSELSWRSQLPIGEKIVLSMADLDRASERWEIGVGRYWNASFSGLPEVAAEEPSLRRFQPLPGETLNIQIQRPVAIEGSSLAIDDAELNYSVGQRARDASLSFTLRSTRGGQHALRLPAAAELIAVSIDGEPLSLRLDQGRLSLPVLPGEQRIEVRFRLAEAISTRVATPELDLGAPYANLRIVLSHPDQRWILFAGGPGVGPAVLYWPQLVLMLIVAFALARIPNTPLRFTHWLLLGLGFSTVSWFAAGLVTAWLLLLAWRARLAERLPSRLWFALLQLGIFGVTAAALMCLLAAIPYGLLGSPDMQITGNGSSAAYLNWFIDRATGDLPSVYALGAPLWVYKLAILAWSLWLANALIGWLRWGWQCFSAGGYWPPRPPKAQAPIEPTLPAASDSGREATVENQA